MVLFLIFLFFPFHMPFYVHTGLRYSKDNDRVFLHTIKTYVLSLRKISVSFFDIRSRSTYVRGVRQSFKALLQHNATYFSACSSPHASTVYNQISSLATHSIPIIQPGTITKSFIFPTISGIGVIGFNRNLRSIWTGIRTRPTRRSLSALTSMPAAIE